MSRAHETTSPERGVLVILSSPSGAGKTTLARRLLDEFEAMEFSVSCTTRPPRTNEQHGVDYVFVTPEEFRRMIAAGELAEWAEVHGNYYGTSQAAVEAALVNGRDVIFDIDWQGGRALSQKWPAESLKIFILPPDFDTLAARLRGRGTDPDDVIQRRLDKAIEEITHYDEYDYLIVNDDLDRAYQALRAIYLVRRHGPDTPGARAEVAYPLAELARTAEQYRAVRGANHAETLIAASRMRKRS